MHVIAYAAFRKSELSKSFLKSSWIVGFDTTRNQAKPEDKKEPQHTVSAVKSKQETIKDKGLKSTSFLLHNCPKQETVCRERERERERERSRAEKFRTPETSKVEI